MTRPKKAPKPKKEVNNNPEVNNGDRIENPIGNPTSDPIEDIFPNVDEWGDEIGNNEPSSTDDDEEEIEEPIFPPFPDNEIEEDIPYQEPPPLPKPTEVDNVIEYHPDRSYFFIFGPGASGKTVLISSILYYLRAIRSAKYSDTLININNSNLKHENEGNKLWGELSRTIFSKTFPRGTTTVQNQSPIPRHINAHFTPSSNSPEFKFCLMDMAGEDLEKLDYMSNHKLPDSIKTYIKELPKKNICFIYILNPEDQYFSNEKKLTLFEAFIDSLDNNNHTNTPLLLLVTKWDTIKNQYSNAEEFVRTVFSPIWGVLKQEKREINIGEFSIGVVSGNDPIATNFETFDPTYPERVFNWMYKTQTGVGLDNETEREKSFFKKIRDTFK